MLLHNLLVFAFRALIFANDVVFIDIFLNPLLILFGFLYEKSDEVSFVFLLNVWVATCKNIIDGINNVLELSVVDDLVVVFENKLGEVDRLLSLMPQFTVSSEFLGSQHCAFADESRRNIVAFPPIDL
jgi:hypothetical protein